MRRRLRRTVSPVLDRRRSGRRRHRARKSVQATSRAVRLAGGPSSLDQFLKPPPRPGSGLRGARDLRSRYNGEPRGPPRSRLLELGPPAPRRELGHDQQIAIHRESAAQQFRDLEPSRSAVVARPRGRPNTEDRAGVPMAGREFGPPRWTSRGRRSVAHARSARTARSRAVSPMEVKG